MCSKDYDVNYEDLLPSFQLPELSTRRLYLQLTLMFKIVHESFFFPPNFFVAMNSTSRHAKLYQPFAYTKSFLYSFVPHSISAWNALPGYVTNMTTPFTFKNAFISSLHTP